MMMMTIKKKMTFYIGFYTNREKIEKTELNFNSVTFNVTMTFGLEEYSGNHGLDDCIKNADNKLYMGKEGGRNKVVF